MKKTRFALALLVMCLCAAFILPSGVADTGVRVYTVTFFNSYPGGGETVQKIAAGQKAEKIADPVRPGYTFAGWFLAYDGGEEFNFDSAINGPTDVFAHWTRDGYTVTYKLNEEGDDSTVVVAEGEKAAKPEDPKSDSYSFLGWYEDGAYTKEYDFETPVTQDIVIYAGWSKSSALVTFALNYTGAPDPVTVNVSMGSPIVVPETMTVERPMYSFDGWFLKAMPGEGDAPVDLNAGIEEDTTLYAGWKRTHYAVVFNPNERGMEAVTVEVPVDDPVAQIPEIVREGYTTDPVWYEDSALTTPVDLTNITDDITVFAKWNLVTYSVSFDTNCEDAAAPEAQTVEYQAFAKRPDNPEREGFTFLGWFTEAEGGDQFNFESSAVTDNVKLFAHWVQAGEMEGNVKVTFNYNAPSIGRGGVYQEVEVPMGQAIGSLMPEDPTLSMGQVFNGWFTDEACTKAFDASAVLMEDTQVYARILVGNVFEAEYVNLAGKHGVGSSVELPEEAMIFDYTKIGSGTNSGADYVSGQLYIAGMYYKGAYIEFEINSSMDVENCILEMRVSSEFKELHFNPLTPETYRIDVSQNGQVNDSTEFLYELPLTLPLPNTLKENDPDGEKTPFENVIVSEKFHLYEGMNYVRFTTNNSYNYGAGTFQANAPMIDCITVYAPSNCILRMTQYQEFVAKKYAAPEY